MIINRSTAKLTAVLPKILFEEFGAEKAVVFVSSKTSWSEDDDRVLARLFELSWLITHRRQAVCWFTQGVRYVVWMKTSGNPNGSKSKPRPRCWGISIILLVDL